MKIMFPGGLTLLSTNIGNTPYPNWSSSQTYSVGSIISSSGSSKGEFQAMVGSQDMSPEDAANVYDVSKNPTGAWKFLGTQNKFRCFDQYLNTQSSNLKTISMTVSAYGAHAIFLGNIDAIDVTISVMDNTSASIIEGPTTIGVITEPTTHEEYGYGDWIDKTQGNITYQRTTLTRDISFVIMVNAGLDTAKLGMCSAGVLREVGDTLWGAELSSLDFSTVVTDTSTGATFLLKGNTAKTLSPKLIADTENITNYYRALNDAQGNPVLFIDDFEVFSVFGYLQKFKQIVTNPKRFETDIDIIGLI